MGVLGHKTARSLRQLFVVSSPGLERCLERELQVLRIPGQMELVPGGIMLSSAPRESLWRIVLQSRIAESVRVHLGEPFHAPDERMLVQRLSSLPWEEYFRSESPSATAQSPFEGGTILPTLPRIKATSTRSRLYHTQMLEARVAAAIEARCAEAARGASSGGRRGSPVDVPEEPSLARASDDLGGGATPVNEQQQRQEQQEEQPQQQRQQRTEQREEKNEEESLPLAPEVRFQVRHDECQVSIVAAGPLHQRGYRKAVGDEPLRETLAAACLLSSPLLRRLSMAAQSDEELVVWDPFCGSGVLVLESLGIVLGTLPAPRQKRYPFSCFPFHAEEAYQETLSSIGEPTRHPAVSKLRLLGTDISTEQLDRAQRNFRRFLRRVDLGPRREDREDSPESSAAAADLPCSVDFQLGAPNRIVKALAGRPVMILSNVPDVVEAEQSRGASSRRRRHAETLEVYSQLGRMLRQHKADWRGVFCISSSAEEFRQHTDAEWTSELRFLSGGRWMDLLQWTGQRKHGEGGGARPRNTRGGQSGGKSWQRNAR